LDKGFNLSQPYSHVSQENVQCLMGYIIDLTVILDNIFRTTAGYVTADDAQRAMDRHRSSSRRERIHRDICNFATETFATEAPIPQRDPVLAKIVDLIGEYCAPPSPSGNG